MAKPEEPKIIFSMIGVSKKIERKEILSDISLSFYYGAKIGVLGFNGSGKSSLMRILALRDTEIEGRVHIEPGYEVGLLEQEPQLAAGKTVRECVEEGVKHLTDLVAAYDATWDQLNEAPDSDKDAIMARQGELQEKIDAAGAWESEIRPLASDSRTICASSGTERTGRHSSKPSCQQSESSVIAPAPAFRRSSLVRMGPTGTPLMATYHSSAADKPSERDDGTSSSFIDLLNAPASASRDGRAAPMRDSDVAIGAGVDPPRVVGASCVVVSGFSTVSVTAARTSIMCPHLRHFILTVLPTTFSSAIWYFALH